MTFRLADYEPILNMWFETNLRYEGTGTAEFSSPAGSVGGQFTAAFDEDGNTLIETVYDSITFDPEYAAGPLGFLTGAKPETKDGVTTWGVGGLENVCKLLSIETPSGKFVSTSDVHLARLSPTPDNKTRLRFYVPEARFDTGNAATPKFFVLPLLNFVGDMGYRLFGDHPLRIYSTPKVPPTLTGNEMLMAQMKSHEMNAVLGFRVEKGIWFVERLPDFEEREAYLRGGGQRRITAVLIGEVGTHAVETVEDFRNWFPTEILSAMGFASGVEVGFPWIEIRDEHGGLIRRLHGRQWLPTFYEGDVVLKHFDVKVDETAPSGLGDILTRYAALTPETRSFLEVVMNHARLGSLGSHLRLYDILDHLIRSLECLCKEYGFVKQELLPLLPTETQGKVKEALTDTAKKLRQMAKDARNTEDLDSARVLQTIASRAGNAAQTEKKFGLSVVELLRKFGLKDAYILDAYLANQLRRDGLEDWASVVTDYRNATIHEGYLDFERKHDAKDVVRVSAHLKDVLTRIVLKAIGYSGTYEPVVARGFGPRSVDWVEATTESSRLGFD